MAIYKRNTHHNKVWCFSANVHNGYNILFCHLNLAFLVVNQGFEEFDLE